MFDVMFYFTPQENTPKMIYVDLVSLDIIWYDFLFVVVRVSFAYAIHSSCQIKIHRQKYLSWTHGVSEIRIRLLNSSKAYWMRYALQTIVRFASIFLSLLCLQIID